MKCAVYSVPVDDNTKLNIVFSLPLNSITSFRVFKTNNENDFNFQALK